MRSRPYALLNRITLFLVAFIAMLLLQVGISYYQTRSVLEPQERRTRSIRSISQFLNDTEGCIHDLENHRWDYGDAQVLTESIKSFSTSSVQHLGQIDADLDSVSEEQYLLAAATRTIYSTYCDTIGQIATLLDAGESEAAAALYYEKAQACGDYMRQYTQQLLECALRESQSSYNQLARLNQRLNEFQNASIIVCFFIGVAMLISLTTLLRSVREMAAASRAISQGNLDIPDVDESPENEIGYMARAFNEMKRSMKRQVQMLEEKNQMQRNLYQKEHEALELQNLMEREKLQQLRSQINPHFMLNTMNVILFTARQEEAQRTQSLIASLGKLLRYALGSNDSQVPLSQEVGIVDQLYALYCARFGERVNLRWQFSSQIDLTETIVPSFILQPLVENAFRHGLGPKESGGTVTVRIWPEEALLLIAVTDDGVGMSQQALEELRRNLLSPPTTGEHIGIYNVAARLRLLGQERQYGLDVDSQQGQGTTATLRLPLVQREEDLDD